MKKIKIVKGCRIEFRNCLGIELVNIPSDQVFQETYRREKLFKTKARIKDIVRVVECQVNRNQVWLTLNEILNEILKKKESGHEIKIKVGETFEPIENCWESLLIAFKPFIKVN